MSNKISNYPTAQASRVLSEESGDFTKDTINSILALGQKGKPRNETELKERINDFFSFCSQRVIYYKILIFWYINTNFFLKIKNI